METITRGGNAPHVMKIEYCGGWGYRPHCTAAIEEIEKAMPG